MARIRSVHPGLASDEAFMSMSMAAKAAWPLLWTECDDAGVFEWKPIVLKARIFPADHVDFAALLGEYEALGCIKRAEAEGRSYGVVRNFCKYQRPKHPSYRHPPGIADPEYTGFKKDDGVKPPPDGGEGGVNPPENPPQMKEEGGSEEKISSPSTEGSPRPKRKQASICPANYAPKERHYAWAAENRQSRAWVDAECARMQRWSATNEHRAIARKSNWDMALDNWLDGALTKLRERTGGTGPPGGPARGAAGSLWTDRMHRKLDQGHFDEPPQSNVLQLTTGPQPRDGHAGSPLREQDRGEAVRSPGDFRPGGAFGF